MVTVQEKQSTIKGLVREAENERRVVAEIERKLAFWEGKSGDEADKQIPWLKGELESHKSMLETAEAELQRLSGKGRAGGKTVKRAD